MHFALSTLTLWPDTARDGFRQICFGDVIGRTAYEATLQRGGVPTGSLPHSNVLRNLREHEAESMTADMTNDSCREHCSERGTQVEDLANGQLSAANMAVRVSRCGLL